MALARASQCEARQHNRTKHRQAVETAPEEAGNGAASLTGPCSRVWGSVRWRLGWLSASEASTPAPTSQAWPAAAPASGVGAGDSPSDSRRGMERRGGARGRYSNCEQGSRVGAEHHQFVSGHPPWARQQDDG